MTIFDEEVDASRGLTLFDPLQTWKQRTYENCTARCLTTPIYQEGRLVYERPGVQAIREYCKAQIDGLWEESLRFEYPHRYYVDLSQRLWDCRQELLETISKLGNA